MNKNKVSNFHVEETNDDARRQALQKLDNARLGWPHIKACLVSGIGFYTDAYDLFVISLALQMIGYSYYPDHGNKVPANYDKGIKVSALVGTLIGQLVFGYLADRLGRKKMYGSELLMIVFFTIIQCFAADTNSGMNLLQMLIMWRLFLGIGIGGDYPLSAIITSEFANTRNRGGLMAAVFAMQGFGILTGSIVSLIVLSIFKSEIENPITEVQYIDITWRLLIGFGAIPGVVAIYFRLTIPESPRYTMDVKGNTQRAVQDTGDMFKIDVLQQQNKTDSMSSTDHVKGIQTQNIPLLEKQQPKATWNDFTNYYSQWKNLKILVGTSVSWFALDVAFYGTNLNTPTILGALNFDDSTAYKTLYHAAVGQIIIAALGLVPGYWVTVATVDLIGRKTIQIGGFAILTVLFFILGGAFNQIKDYSTTLFFFVYTLIQFFTNFGPNSTTFIVPGEVFPTRYRSTCHGISAASGKLGAIVALIGFSSLKDHGGKDAFIPQLFIIFGIFMLIGLVASFLIPETKGKSLEELAQEDD